VPPAEVNPADADPLVALREGLEVSPNLRVGPEPRLDVRRQLVSRVQLARPDGGETSLCHAPLFNEAQHALPVHRRDGATPPPRRRGVKRGARLSGPCFLTMPSIQPKHSASSTASL